MSHNANRLPRALRMAHTQQLLKSTNNTTLLNNKCSRKYRRRAARLADAFARRKMKVRWLQTHLWHAKRFHMRLRWGYSIPDRPCDKSFRACYRASSAHCLLQDISYFRSIVLTGPLDILTAGFQQLSASPCGLTITAKAFVNSPREGHVYLFKPGQYPQGCLGKVSFFWKPSNGGMKRSVWLFIHPAYFEDIKNQIVEVFSLQINDKSDLNDWTIKEVWRNKQNIVLVDNKNTFNRFRLTGPLSHCILVGALSSLSDGSVMSEGIKRNWFESYLNNKLSKDHHIKQSIIWDKMKHIQSSSELPPHLVLGLNVKDPRTNLPFKRIKALPVNQEEDELFLQTLPHFSESALWDDKLLQIISENILTTSELNKLREKYSLIAGEEINQGIPGVPVILTQRPGSQDCSYKNLGKKTLTHKPIY